MAFIGLPVIYRDFAARAGEGLEADPRVGMPVMKSIAWVRSNTRVTVVVVLIPALIVLSLVTLVVVDQDQPPNDRQSQLARPARTCHKRVR